MSDLTFNKIAGATLATALAVFGLKEVSAMAFGHHELEKPGYAVDVPEEAAGAAAEVELPPDWGTVLPTANVQAGEAVFAKCTSCHTDTQGGANGTGPNLWGIVGRHPASHGGFAYSAAMTEFGAKQPVWDYEHLYEYLKAPGQYVPGTKMTFVGLKKQEDRINIVAYLKTMGGTLPVPPPNPAAAAPAADAAAAPDANAAAPAAEGEPAATAETAPAAAKTASPA
ncbi:MAG: cytochrome c family protein [Caulobacteraceae bacterium]|nr:cytochrome c family protein [Caulobacteraceae bacterium]